MFLLHQLGVIKPPPKNEEAIFNSLDDIFNTFIETDA